MQLKTTQQLTEYAELTDRIVANLKFIEENDPGEDYLVKLSEAASCVKYIEENGQDTDYLDKLESAAASAQYIEDHPVEV